MKIKKKNDAPFLIVLSQANIKKAPQHPEVGIFHLHR